MSAPKIKARKFSENYETRMIGELAQRLVELEEAFRDHLVDCKEAAAARYKELNPEAKDPAMAFRKTPRDLEFTRPRCEACKAGIPHNAEANCDSAQRDISRRRRDGTMAPGGLHEEDPLDEPFEGEVRFN